MDILSASRRWLWTGVDYNWTIREGKTVYLPLGFVPYVSRE